MLVGLLISRVSCATNFSVGVIGAGISGLYAAILLQSLGIDYEVLEANNRPGGRILTHYFDIDAWKTSSPGQPQYYDYFVSRTGLVPDLADLDRMLGPCVYRKRHSWTGLLENLRTHWCNISTSMSQLRKD